MAEIKGGGKTGENVEEKRRRFKRRRTGKREPESKEHTRRRQKTGENVEEKRRRSKRRRSR